MPDDYTVEDKRPFDKDGHLKDDEDGSGGKPQKVEMKSPDIPIPEKPSMLQKILAGDVIGKFIDAGLMPSKYTVENNKIVPNTRNMFPDFESPWIFFKNDLDRDCAWSMDIGMIFQFIPKKCRNCWKVVVYPRTLKELFMLKKLMQKMSDEDPFCTCKCGIEKRESVERHYGGYFYNNSIEQGLLKLRLVREMVAKHIDPDIRVILKRGCTEYERAFGNSDQWDVMFKNDYYEVLETTIQKMSVPQPMPGGMQTDLMKNHVMANWIKFAAGRGDPSVKELNNGKTLYPDYVTYEEEDAIYEGDNNAKDK